MKLSNLASRVIVALFAIPAVLFISYNGGILFFLFVSAVSCLALNEFYAMAALKGASPQRTVGIVAGFFLSGAFFHEHIQSLIASMFSGGAIAAFSAATSGIVMSTLLFFIVLILLIELFRNKGSVFMNAGYTILGVVYIASFLGTSSAYVNYSGTIFHLVSCRII